MKVSIQLRQFGKSGSESKVYFRLRDGKIDMKAASSLTIHKDFWDGENYRYKTSTPTNMVSESVQNLFNEKVKVIITTLNE